MVEEDTRAPLRPEGAPDPHAEDHAHDIYTLANIITMLRLMLTPFFFAVLISGRSDVIAFLLFALAASTDWLDGQVARRTRTVSALGKAIDPLVDRLLIASGVVGLFLRERLPLWIVVLLIARDIYLLFGANFLARRHMKPIPVVFLGKFTTALLFLGFSDLILGWPLAPGLGLVESAWAPGWGSTPAAVGVWFVYVGLVTSVITALVYTWSAGRAVRLQSGAQA